MKKQDCFVTSKRGTQIPCSVVIPQGENPMPLVLMAHGFCATRDENGTFPMLAEKLAAAGIASIRCDFPGCHDSKESMVAYTVENCQDDLDSVLAYMEEQIPVLAGHVGVVGYSLGGRVTLHYTKRHPEIRTIALWAPAAMNGFEDMEDGFGDAATIQNRLEVSARDGYYPYENDFDGTIKTLSYDFWKQMQESRAREYFHEFTGNCIMVYGDQDVTVKHQVLDVIATESNPQADFVCHVVSGANHGFGAWTNEPEQMVELTDATAAFLIEKLGVH
jgi:pimeloyl-ACP methyl ester carboxylesterase